ncbi:EamA domain-containing protein [Plasmodiophora brassicae]|uniref:Uncharacterized protein n=1 Tax=Plasmodiophora brassicae TaxID=37360 RepID=A0A0G4J2Z4_PLABS|nr:hypothetical protein PBRA_008543 [Plasmodiophora brassicae]SPR01771.1 unnamed protein product [Plasmodiophora brassicae]
MGGFGALGDDDRTWGVHHWVIGVVLACLASVISNLGINLQKLSHMRRARGRAPVPLSSPTAPTTASALSDINQTKYYLQPLWVSGITLVILGAIADFFALAFAPQVVIAPLGSVTLIANVFFAPLLLEETINRREVLAVSIIIIGSVISVWFASHDDKLFGLDELFELYTKPRFLIFAVLIMGIICVMLSALEHYDRLRADAVTSQKASHAQLASLLDDGHVHSDADLAPQLTPAMIFYQTRAVKIHRFLYPALSGIIGAQNVLFAKCTAELLYGSMAGGKLLFVHLPTYMVIAALGITIFFQIKYLNDGLYLFEASYVVPVFQTFWCLGSVASGLVFFGEYQHMQAGQMSMFFLGIGVTVSGLMLLSKREVRDQIEDWRPSPRPRRPARRQSVHVELGGDPDGHHPRLKPAALSEISMRTDTYSDTEPSPRSYLLTANHR